MIEASVQEKIEKARRLKMADIARRQMQQLYESSVKTEFASGEMIRRIVRKLRKAAAENKRACGCVEFKSQGFILTCEKHTEKILDGASK